MDWRVDWFIEWASSLTLSPQLHLHWPIIWNSGNSHSNFRSRKKKFSANKRKTWFRSGGYGSIPIIINSNGMNIHLPAILMFTRGTRFWHTARCKQGRRRRTTILSFILLNAWWSHPKTAIKPWLGSHGTAITVLAAWTRPLENDVRSRLFGYPLFGGTEKTL